MNALAPRLRHRVDVQDLIVAQDSDGAVTQTWASLLDSEEVLLPAQIAPMSGRELVAAAQVQAGVDTRITLRHWRLPFTARMRIVHPADGVVYSIRAVLPDPTLRHHVTLLAEAGVNDG